MSEDLNSGSPSVESTPAPEHSGPQSLSDTISRALDVSEARQADRAAGKDVAPELPSVAPDRARDQHGKFAPKPREPAAPKGAEQAAVPAPETQQAATAGAAAAQAAPAAPAVQPPVKWSEAKKADFARLTPDAQALVLQHTGEQDADYTRKTQELADQRKHVEPFVGALQEHGQFLQSMSQQIRQPPARIVGDVLQAYRQLVTGAPHERAQTLAFMANVAGIDLRALVGGQAAQPQQGNVPEPILRELTQLRQQVGDLQGFRQMTEQERQQQSLQTAQQQIDAFRAAKDEQGQPKYPHFDAVRGFMAPFVEAGQTFDEAYANAAKPITDAIASRDARAKAEREASEAQARTAAEAADKARAASVARARSAGGPRPAGSQPGMTARPDLNSIIDASLDKAGFAR